MCDISIHAPTRGATENCKCSECPLTISIHAPTRGATVSGSMVYPVLSNFNPRSYKRSDALAPFLLYPAFIFQSTLLQEERRGSGSGIIYPPFISIHAPTRGATSLWMLQRNSGSISIHAPTRGATLYLLIFSFYRNFNPRSYKRSDLPARYQAPGWDYFNPRSYKRSDSGRLTTQPTHATFQSTLLQEERLPRMWNKADILNYFNPRSYKRSDRLECLTLGVGDYFNPRSYKRSDIQRADRFKGF